MAILNFAIPAKHLALCSLLAFIAGGQVSLRRYANRPVRRPQSSSIGCRRHRLRGRWPLNTVFGLTRAGLAEPLADGLSQGLSFCASPFLSPSPSTPIRAASGSLPAWSMANSGTARCLGGSLTLAHRTSRLSPLPHQFHKSNAGPGARTEAPKLARRLSCQTNPRRDRAHQTQAPAAGDQLGLATVCLAA